MKTLSVKLPEALDARLTALSRERGTTKSALIREAIEAMVSGNGGPRSVSCADLAGDLIGCFDGPRDLSTNRDHMEGFGK